MAVTGSRASRPDDTGVATTGAGAEHLSVRRQSIRTGRVSVGQALDKYLEVNYGTTLPPSSWSQAPT
jgi:hypothetical protein